MILFGILEKWTFVYSPLEKNIIIDKKINLDMTSSTDSALYNDGASRLSSYSANQP